MTDNIYKTVVLGNNYLMEDKGITQKWGVMTVYYFKSKSIEEACDLAKSRFRKRMESMALNKDADPPTIGIDKVEIIDFIPEFVKDGEVGLILFPIKDKQ